MCASHVRCSFVLSLYLTNRNKLDERGHFHQKRALRMYFFLQFKQCLNRNKQMVVICPQTRYTTTRNVHANIHIRYFFFIENFSWCIDFSSSNDFMGVLKCLRKISIYTTDLKSFLWQILVLYFVFFFLYKCKWMKNGQKHIVHWKIQKDRRMRLIEYFHGRMKNY